MLKKMMLIVNPFSGKGKAKESLFDIVDQFCRSDYSVNVFLVSEKHPAQSLARDYAAGYDLVACVGGDGTLSDVSSGLMLLDERPPLGYIPMGTANDVATTLTLSRDPAAAASSIINGTPVPFDIGEFGNQFFTYIVAFGAFTEVSYSTPQDFKKALGHLAYVLQGMMSLPSVKPVHAIVELDNETVEGDFIFGSVTNSTSVAGIVKLDPNDVSLSDGIFEIVLVKQPESLAEFSKLVENVMQKNFQSDKIQLFHSSKVSFTFNSPVEWTRDGEAGGSHQHVEIINHHKAINMVL